MCSHGGEDRRGMVHVHECRWGWEADGVCIGRWGLGVGWWRWGWDGEDGRLVGGWWRWDGGGGRMMELGWDGEDGRLDSGGGRMEVRTSRQGWCVYEVGRCVLGEVGSGEAHMGSRNGK